MISGYKIRTTCMLAAIGLCVSAAIGLCVSAAMPVMAELPVGYKVEAIINAGSGDFAPYYVSSNRHGILTQNKDAMIHAAVLKPLATDTRFSYGFGIEAVGGYSSSSEYLRFDGTSGGLVNRDVSPAPIFLQQLFGEIKYRGVFLTVGMKQHESVLLNFSLSSGDLVESGNSRPIPEVRLGFVDFQDIPFTDGWLQIQGEISYGKFADNNWMKHHYNYYNWHINLGGFYTYKRAYFRTKPAEALSVTVGMQTAGMFGGITSQYVKGEMVRQTKCPQSVKAFFKMFIPSKNSGSGEFVDGNFLGSWDVLARYRLSGGGNLKAYVQKPWEDGSGIGWLNGFDGVWGLEYESADRNAIVSGVVVEYLDFTNQSGPIHWSPGDAPGTTITSNATGGDEYYNNFQSNSYMNYGMSIGTPFLPSPIYNRDGYMAYIHNRVRGFHAGIEGAVSSAVRYRVLGSYRKAWGDGRIPTSQSYDDTSMMFEAEYSIPSVAGLKVTGQVAFDRGTIYGDTFGVAVSVGYSGNFNLFRK